MSLVIIGEFINTSVKSMKTAVKKRDAAAIRDIAVKQDEAGAHYIDLNCETEIKNEEECIAWLARNVQQVTAKPLCITSRNPATLEAGLEHYKNGQPMINSITGEKEIMEKILPIVTRYGARIIVILKDDSGIPQTARERIEIADKIIPRLLDSGVTGKDIFIDPLVKPVSTDNTAGVEVLESIRSIGERFPEVHCVCGLSNISYGLPNRRILNHAFMIQAMAFGANAFILNPLDKQLMGFMFASQVILGRDSFCSEFLSAHRRGLYE